MKIKILITSIRGNRQKWRFPLSAGKHCIPEIQLERTAVKQAIALLRLDG